MSLKSARIRDLKPEVRVIVETTPAKFGVSAVTTETGEAAGVYVPISPSSLMEFTEVTGCTTTVGVAGKATANLTLASHRDVLFGKARKMSSRNERRQKEISEYMTEVLKVSSLYEINPRRRPLSPGVRRMFGVPVEKLGRFAKRLQFIFEEENGHESSAPEPKNRIEEYSAYEWFICDWKPMRRIWIDFKDRNGVWVAGFTGIVSTVSDYYNVGDTPMVTLGCSGTMRFFELTEFITKQSVDNQEWPFETGTTDFPLQAESNIFQGMSPQDVMEYIANGVNLQFSLTGAELNTVGQAENRRPQDFYYHDLILNTENPISFGERDQAIDPARLYQQNVTKTTDLLPKLIIDPWIAREDRRRAAVYREAFQLAFEFYSFENATGHTIGRDSAVLMNYDFYEDPKGNINLWAPRYDWLPRIRGERGVVDADRKTYTVGELSGAEESNFVSPFLGIDFSQKLVSTRFGEDYSDLPFHDGRYILDDVSMLSWNLAESEEAIKTFVRVTNQPHFLNQDKDFAALANTGYTSFKALKVISEDLANEVQRLARRFGVRRYTMPTVHTKSAAGETDMLTRFAYAGLARVNGYAFSGTVNLEQRPELWPGRSIFLVERQRLAYITKVTNEFKAKQSHRTTLTLAYLHHPLNRIGIPWWEATEGQSTIPRIEAILQPREE